MGSVASGPSPRTGGGGAGTGGGGGGGSASDRGTNIGNKNISGGLAQHAGRAAMAVPGAAKAGLGTLARGMNAAGGAAAGGVGKAIPWLRVGSTSALQGSAAGVASTRAAVARGWSSAKTSTSAAWDTAKASPGKMGGAARKVSNVANTVSGATGKVAGGAKDIAAATMKGAQTGLTGQIGAQLKNPMMGPPAPKTKG